MKRKLTDDERAVLEMIKQGHGNQYSERKVFFSDHNDAIIYLNLADAELFINLTVTAMFRKDGTIASDEELKRDWLHIVRLPKTSRHTLKKWGSELKSLLIFFRRSH